jgi:hypothetical protein
VRSNRVVRAGISPLTKAVETLRRTYRALLSSDQLKDIFAVNGDVSLSVDADACHLTSVLVGAREAAGLTQRDLAARLKRPHSFVGRFEAGERRIDVVEFIEIARVLEVDPRHLFAKLLD